MNIKKNISATNVKVSCQVLEGGKPHLIALYLSLSDHSYFSASKFDFES